MQQKEVILEGTIKAFNEKGLKFTMDDVAKILGMSKKTIYTVFRDKESMFLAMVDYMFDSIKESEQQIVEDDALSTGGGHGKKNAGEFSERASAQEPHKYRADTRSYL